MKYCRKKTPVIQTINAYLDDPELRRRHGQASQERVIRSFRPDSIWNDLYKEYWKLLNKKSVV
jgi:glycosyltransferase involved in cell wall biosynthesis